MSNEYNDKECRFSCDKRAESILVLNIEVKKIKVHYNMIINFHSFLVHGIDKYFLYIFIV